MSRFGGTMRVRMISVIAAVVAIGGLVAIAPAAVAAPPASPGDSKNCGDFPGWNEAQVWFETYRPYYGDVGHLDADGDGIPCEDLPGAPTATAPATGGDGYRMFESNGTVFGFGTARPLTPVINDVAVAAAAAPAGGYWILTASGAVQSRGAQNFGNAAVPVGDHPATIAGLPDGSGYWVITRRGRVYPFGNAKFYGDASSTPLVGDIIASAPTPTGKGYWLVGSDGGIFTYGDAAFYGSTGNMRLNQPVVGIAADPDGVGYWLVAADGGIFSFQAAFHGSVPQQLKPGQKLNRPVIGALAYGNGYLMVASDGGIFAFSDRPFLGSLGATPPPNPVVAVAVRAAGQ